VTILQKRVIAVWLLMTAAYIIAGIAISSSTGMIYGDALSRVADASFALRSRDPHLGAIGTVFSPLPALLSIPFVPLASWWPELIARGWAAIFSSGAAMAFATIQLVGFATDRGWPRRSAIALVGIGFCLHPMIVLYAVNGMGEALFIAMAVTIVRTLSAWRRGGSVNPLVASAVALSLLYLVRYEAVVVGAGVVAVTAIHTAQMRRDQPLNDRLRAATMASTVAGFPLAIAVVGWALTSWILTGELFAQLSSLYGNRAILALEGATGSGFGTAAAMVFVLSPGILVLVSAALVLGWRRRDHDAVVAMVVLAPSLAFNVVAIAIGASFQFLRFTILAIPIAIIAVIVLRPFEDPPIARLKKPTRMRASHAVAWLIVAGFVVGALPTSVVALQDRSLGSQDHAVMMALSALPGPIEERTLRTFATERELAHYIDRLDPDDGLVLVDTTYGFAVVAASSRPERFVIPGNRDFRLILDDPASHDVGYILTVPPTGRGRADAINRRYPTLHSDGAGLAVLALEIPNDGDQPDWRLYRLPDGPVPVPPIPGIPPVAGQAVAPAATEQARISTASHPGRSLAPGVDSSEGQFSQWRSDDTR